MSENPTRHCFVCGPDNPIALGAWIRMEGDRCLADFTPGPNHVGWTGVVHGGIQFSLMDDVMANWLWQQGERGVTARCEVRYRESLPVGVPVRAEAWLVERRRRLARLGARVRAADDPERVFAECEATFMITG